MATKAQLETELADLKRQLAARETVSDSVLDTAPNDIDPTEGGVAAMPEGDVDIVDWEEQIHDVMKELEDLPQNKPLLFALGAFALGYLIGRSK